MNDAEKINVLRAAFVSMLHQLRLADLHMGLMNQVSLENKARIALERSGDDKDDGKQMVREFRELLRP